jgi:hypothetical protein
LPDPHAVAFAQPEAVHQREIHARHRRPAIARLLQRRRTARNRIRRVDRRFGNALNPRRCTRANYSNFM